jgi:hypothetical protein
MKTITTKHDSTQAIPETAGDLFDDWFDPIESAVREQVRGFIQTMIEGELEATLARPRYGRRPRSSDGNDRGVVVTGHRHGHRSRSLMGSFGRIELEVPRAAEQSRRQNLGMEKPSAARLPAPYAGSRCVDCQHLSGRHQHAPGSSGVEGTLRRRREQGYGEPGLAQGEGRLGCISQHLI